MIAKTILPFKLVPTDETITPHAGLAVFGEFLRAMGVDEEVRRFLPRPGSGRGYAAWGFVQPLLLMLHAGGRSLEDVQVLQADRGLLELLQVRGVPSADAVGDFLRRLGRKGGPGLRRLHRRVIARALGREDRTAYTLDIDATAIEAHKKEAAFTYKGFKGYMPLVGHLAENGLVLQHDFREGNEAPSDRNLPFLHACLEAMPRGKRITAFRADAASFQKDLLDTLAGKGIAYAVGARLNPAVKAAIQAIPPEAWRPFEDGFLAETPHRMQAMDHDFRLIVFRRRGQGSLFEEDPFARLTAVAAHREGSAEEVLTWYRARGEHSENRIKEIKIGFGLERMPCGQSQANAAFFSLGVLAYNLYKLFLVHTLGPAFARCQVQSLRFRLYAIAGKIVRHAGALLLKVPRETFGLLHTLRLGSPRGRSRRQGRTATPRLRLPLPSPLRPPSVPMSPFHARRCPATALLPRMHPYRPLHGTASAPNTAFYRSSPATPSLQSRDLGYCSL